MPPDHSWASEDRRLGLALGSDVLDHVLNHCRVAGGNETGGILVGRYNENHDTAVVTRATGAPSDSTATRRGFRRGIRGLRAFLARLWREGHEYYLGEWHYHPHGPPEPSGNRRGTDAGPCPDPGPALSRARACDRGRRPECHLGHQRLGGPKRPPRSLAAPFCSGRATRG